MNQGFKLRFDQMRENAPAQAQPDAQDQATSDRPVYEAASVRNLHLVWLDGRESFLNYAYLVHAEFSHGDDLNEILLNFSGYVVALRGYLLQALFAELVDHLPRVILQEDPRYLATGQVSGPVVTEIMVAKPS
ncbi:hypothetical protein DYBT9275_04896 [Dyadobacter sp. CECT 9275]|uniref:Uncharacterized protein n=1 Tax=Dyadobacter helix TaxID=2822344 RepID=A0A916JGL0_9BACT|nr:hypothetical protein [Dyadobacter sp. CECT 9275]CAG5011163.1 hypothetical protein DYBT9275_04896 [Dyadobacter sp. CECT 9275]